jgi:hypothetical protein
MIVNLTKRERATILAALRRWLSYPAAREADSIATNGGKQKPLDNAEIDRLCRHIIAAEPKRNEAHLIRQSKNGGPERKDLKLRDGLHASLDEHQRRLGDTKRQRDVR